MLPFSVNLKRGQPAHQQILAAVREALASGQLRDGDPFPSARVLTQELRISPSVAQKVVTTLREEGFLARQQGSGLIVRAAPASADALPTMPGPLSGFATSEDTGSHIGDPAYPFLAAADKPNILGLIEGYEVSRLLARGGMGLVFDALDRALMRRVAIKVLAPQIAASSEARARFLREARAAAAVDHENVLPVHAVSEANGYPYLVMPLVSGESLQARLHREGPLPLKELLRIAIRIARGLAAAHARGLIHRDIKPDNVLLETGGASRVWIADFGLARALEDENITHSGVIAGTPRYASPEQAEGRKVDHRTDLFSFGSVLYAMATGDPPFQAENVMAILRKIVEDPLEPPRRRRGDLPADLDDLIVGLLQKAPEDRPATASEVMDRLDTIRPGSD